jgi:hypothetical protein
MGTASCVWVFAWFLYFRDNPAKHKGITQAELEALPSYLDGAARKCHPVPWGPLCVRMLPVTFVFFCYGWTLWLFLSLLPQYFKNQHHLDLDKTAIFSAGVLFRRSSRRYPRWRDQRPSVSKNGRPEEGAS